MVRKIGNFQINQRTKDGMFNATELLKQWNKETGTQKLINHFFENRGTKDFISVLETEEGYIRNSEDSSVSATYVVIRGNKSKGRENQYWMHPILFTKFAMWLNPKFEYFVIRFVYDQLIEYRHSAGDNYRGITSAVQRFDNVNYAQLAKGLNWIVFGRHERELRQKATEKQLQELSDLQKKLAFAIDMGYIRSYSELINEMRRIYHYKSHKF